MQPSQTGNQPTNNTHEPSAEVPQTSQTAANSEQPAQNTPGHALNPTANPTGQIPKHPKLAPPLQPAAQTTVDGDDVENDVEDTEEKQPNPFLGALRAIFSWIILPGLIVLFLHSFVFQAFYVSGSSMNPDFQDGDYLIIDKVGFTLSSIKSVVGLDTSLDLKRGDVLVFRYPNSPGTFFIKRLIGLPGERVVLKNGKFTIYNNEHPDGLELDEPYIDQSLTTQGEIDETIEKDKYFVVGDNRAPNGSFDSREWGQLPREDIVGVATARLLPINELGPIKHPTY